MNYENCALRPAGPGEGDAALELIRRRVAWMDEKGIDQWNRSGYLNYYPAEFFRREAEAGRLYFLYGAAGERMACAVLLEEDERWEDQTPALYIHNLAAALNCPGAGTELIRRCMELARTWDKRYPPQRDLSPGPRKRSAAGQRVIERSSMKSPDAEKQKTAF